MKNHTLLMGCVFAVLLCLPGISAYSSTYYVYENGDDSNTGLSEVSPWATIQYALDQTGAGDTIIALKGHYVLSTGILIDGDDSGTVLLSKDGADSTFIESFDTAAVQHLFSFENVGDTFLLEGFTIECGTSLDSPAIYLSSSSPKFRNCLIINDTGSAAVSGVNSSPQFINCTVAGNAGYGLYFTGTSFPALKNSIIWGNSNSLFGVDAADVRYCDIEDSSFAGINGNFSADPLFIGGGNYHLSMGSPCIDEGDTADDYSLEPEPNWDRINVGAYGNTRKATRSSPIYFEITEYAEVMPFQYPIGVEHLEHDVLLDGFFTAYKDGIEDTWIWSSYDERTEVDTVSREILENNHVVGTIKVVVRSSDSMLQITQIFSQTKSKKYFTVRAIIENISNEVLTDVIFKRYTDWDVGNDHWDDTFDWDIDRYLVIGSDLVYCGLASLTRPDRWDYDGWDKSGLPDYNNRKTDEDWVVETPPLYSCDGLPVFDMDLHELWPGERQQFYFLYCTGDTKAELQQAWDEVRDTDYDELLDPWEYFYFGDLAQDPHQDFDGDGLSNEEEWELATDPTDTADPVTMWVDKSNLSGTWLGTEQYPFKVIQDGIDTPDRPHIVRIKPGTYYENLDMAENVYLMGEDRNSVIIDGQGLESVVMFDRISECKIDNVTITNGFYIIGGGIYSYSSSPLIKNCTIIQNDASIAGAGIFLGNDSIGTPCYPLIKNSIVRDNIILGTFGFGAGVCVDYYAAPTIVNSIIDYNQASATGSYAGGVAIVDANCTITNCTILYNSAADSTGGIMGLGDFSAKITNSIIWGNGIDLDNIDADMVSHCDIQNSTFSDTNGNFSLDPLFVNSAAKDYRLQLASPCIDTGTTNPVELPHADFAGNARILYGGKSFAPDIGAHEYYKWFRFSRVDGSDTFTLSWPCKAGKIYSVYYNDDSLSNPAQWQLATDSITATENGIISWSDGDYSGTSPSPSAVPHRFYKVLFSH